MAISGVWNIVFNGPTGAQELVVTLDDTSGELTGTVVNDLMGVKIDVTNGTVSGDDVQWQAAMTTPLELLLEFAGTVDGDSISGTVKVPGMGEFPFEGKRT